MRRYLIIAAVVIVILGIGVAVYFYFFTGASVSVTTPGSSTLPTAGSTSVSLGSSTGSSTPVVVTGVTSSVAPRLVEIDKNITVAGAVALDVMATTTGTSTAPDIEINYLERQSGNVFSYLFNAARLTRISNRTIPGIQEAGWASDGTTVLVRYLSGDDSPTINTYALTANGSGGSFLPQDLTGLVTSGEEALTLASGVNGSIASIVQIATNASTQAFTTPLAQIRAQFLGTKEYLVTTKASASQGGYAYSVDSAGDFTRIIGPLDGLVTLASPSGTWILASYTDAGVMKMELVNTQTFAVLPLPVATIADKCVWTEDEEAIYCGIPIDPSTAYAYPDDWYQGAVSFSDRIWKIDVTGRFAELTLDFPTATTFALDATNLAIDPEGKVLVFRNKIDGSLWAYQL